MRTLPVIQAVGAAAVLMVGGCGSSTDTDAQPATSFGVDTTSPVAEVVERQRVALENYDVTLAVELTCTEFKERERAAAEELRPPLSQFATPGQATDPEFMAALQRRLVEQDGLAPPAAAALTNAVRAQDQAAFDEAVVPYVAARFEVVDAQAQNIKVDGNTADAEVTVTIQKRGAQPETHTEQQHFIREDGEWVECTP